MAWTITAALNPSLPGSIRLDIGGDANADVIIWRRSDGQGIHPPQRVRGVTNMGGGLLQIIDPEAPVAQTVTYEVESGGQMRAVSGPVYVPAPVSALGGDVALIRSIEAPTLLWSPVTVVEERPEREVTADVFPVLGRRDPIVVSDVLRLESGTLVFLALDIQQADRIIEVLQPGAPVVYRTPCTGKTRDKIFTVTGTVQDTLYDVNRTWRIISVPFQQITWPDSRPLPPQALPHWLYSDLDRPTQTAPTYNVLAATRQTYFDLATNPVTP